MAGSERKDREQDGERSSKIATPVASWIAAPVARMLAEPWRDLVGVDLGSASVKVARAVRVRGRIARIEVAERSLPPTHEGDRRQAIAGALAEIAAGWNLRGKPAAAALRGNENVVRRITLPCMSRADLVQALKLECRKHVQYPIEEAEIRYEILPQAETGPEATLNLLVAVAPRRAVLEARDTLARAGLRAVSLTIRPVALRSLLRARSDFPGDEVVAYLDIGAAESHILVFRGDEIRFVREFGIGTLSLNDSLRSIVIPGQGTVELSADAADALRREHGIPLGDQEGALAGSIPLSAVSIMLRPILERLVRELWNSFDYCNEQYQGESVCRVVVVGEGARIPNLPKYLSGVLKIPVEEADPSVEPDAPGGRSRDGDSPAPAPELAVGLSLLQRGSMNFLEPAGAGVPYRLADAVPQRVAAGAAAVLLLSLAVPAEVNVSRARQEVGVLRAQVADFRPRIETLERFRVARGEESRTRDLIGRLSAGRLVWSDVLRDMSHRVGSDARLLSFEVRGADGAGGPAVAGVAPAGVAAQSRTARISGLLRTEGRRPEAVLGELMKSLGRSPAFEQVWLEGCQVVAPGLSGFALGALLAE